MKKTKWQLLIWAVIISVVISPFQCFAKNATNIFSDVPEKEWYTESVEYVKDNGLMNGITVTTFEPETCISRGMIVTIIYRLEGSPDVKSDLQFSDVNSTYYYCTPIIWASENGIVNGYSKDTFAPDDEITREQFATILYRYAERKGIDVSLGSESIDLSNFDDESKISEYAVNALSWANEKGLIKGVTVTTLEPQGKATRAQAATIFMRFDKQLKESVEADDLPEKSDEKTNDNKDDETVDKKPSHKEESTDKDNITQTKPDSDDKQNDNYDTDDNNTGENDEASGEKNKSEDENDTANNDENEKEEIFTEPAFVVDSVFARAGETIEVKVKIHNNPGVLGAILNFKFDPELELVDAQKGAAFSQLEITKPGKFVSDCNFVWDGLSKPADNDGTVLTLYFDVSDNVKKGKELDIQCSYLAGDIIDENFKELDILIVDGVVTIE